MKHLVFTLLLTTVTAHAAAPLTDKERYSYAMGQDLSRSVKQLEVDVDVNALVQGLRDSLEGNAQMMSAAELTVSRDQLMGSRTGTPTAAWTTVTARMRRASS